MANSSNYYLARAELLEKRDPVRNARLIAKLVRRARCVQRSQERRT